jgi:phage pi2 protein 07
MPFLRTVFSCKNGFSDANYVEFQSLVTLAADFWLNDEIQPRERRASAEIISAAHFSPRLRKRFPITRFH